MYYKNFIKSKNANGNLLKYLIVSFSLLMMGFNLQAKNYYFSSSSGNDSYTSTQAQNQATPWKSISKLNAIFSTLVAGDAVYFKSGDTFFGSIVVNRSGSSSSPITIGAYGTGNKPVISGFTTLSSWTLVTNGIYQATASGISSAVNLVTLNNQPQAIGRFPNANAANGGYLKFESSSTNSITDNELSSATNWKGAELVVRKARHVVERWPITAHSGGTLTYATSGSPYPKTNNGYGYFIQKDIRCLDQLGEWFYNTSSKYLQMYFGSSSPSSFSVKVSTVDILLNTSNYSNININGLAFEGANVSEINIGSTSTNTSKVTVQNCSFNSSGRDAIYATNADYPQFTYNTINNSLSNGIVIENEGGVSTFATVSHNTIKNTGRQLGMGAAFGNSYQGITAYSSDATIEYNNIDSTGYIPISFYYNNAKVRYNYITNYLITKDDGGGIYTFSGPKGGPVYTGREVKNNIIINGVGAGVGTPDGLSTGNGIYLDDGTVGVTISGNSVSTAPIAGIYIHNTHEVTITDNTAYNCAYQQFLFVTDANTPTDPIRNATLKRNTGVARISSQLCFSMRSVNNDLNLSGPSDSNYWARPVDDNLTMSFLSSVSKGSYSLTQWITSFGTKDMHSKKSPKTIPAASVDAMLRFEYNATADAKTVNLGANYISIDGTAYNGSITLQPYTSKVLIYVSGTVAVPPSSFTATASAPAVSCFGSSTTATVTATGGTSPYTGVGSYSLTAGKGSLKISVPVPVPLAYTLAYANIGAISSSKTYVLKFTTLGTTGSGSLRASLRQTNAPWSYITATQSRTFGTSRVDHQFVFSAPATQSAASFLIEIAQSSGTVYIDNLAFSEGTSTGALTGYNLFSGGDFEKSISNITVWSLANNHSAALDLSSKINSTYYLPVKDAKGAISNVPVTITQPGAALQATYSAATVTTTGGYANVVISASGGTAPYTGTGTISQKVGTLPYTVKDSKGCTYVVSVTVKAASGARVGSTVGSGTDVGSVSDSATSESVSTEAAGQLKINSYPNPTTTEFGLVVEGGSGEAVNISVMSTDGRVVYKTQGTSNKRYTFGGNFMNGVYVIQVMQGKTMQTLKVIKAK